jgi:ankyrin repeat protein
MNNSFNTKIETLKKAFNNKESSVSFTSTNGNYKNKSGNTILHYFILNIDSLKLTLDLQIFILKKILEFDKNINLKNNDGYTPLMLAIQKKYVDIAKELLKTPGIEVNIQGPYGNTALNLAIIYDLDSIADELLNIPGININLPGNNHDTALISAIKDRKHGIVNKMLKLPGIIFDLKDRDGHTALMSLIIFYNKENFNTLIEKDGIGINLTDNDEDTALILCLPINSKNIFDKLLKVPGININLQNKKGENALMIAIEFNRNNYFSMELLNVPGININLQNKGGKNALMIAIVNRNNYISMELLKIKGINLYLKDKGNRTALDIAKELNNQQIIKAIEIVLSTMPADINSCVNKNLKEFISCICNFIIYKANIKNFNIKNNNDIYNIIIEYLRKNYNLKYIPVLGKVIIKDAVKGEALLTFTKFKPYVYHRKIQIEYKSKITGLFSGINAGGLTRNFFFECQQELHQLFSKKPINSNKIEYYNKVQERIEFNNYINIVNLLFFSKINNCPIYLDKELFSKLSQIILNLIIISNEYSLIQKIFIINMLLKYKDIFNKELYYGMYDLLLTERHRINMNNMNHPEKLKKESVINTYISEINKEKKIKRNAKNQEYMNKEMNKLRNSISQNNNKREICLLIDDVIDKGIYKDYIDFYYTHFIPDIITFEIFMKNLIFIDNEFRPPINRDEFITNIKKLLEYMNSKDKKNILLLAQAMSGNTLSAPTYKINLYSTLTGNNSKLKPANFHTCSDSVDFFEDNFPFVITSNNKTKNDENLEIFIHLLKSQIDSNFIA